MQLETHYSQYIQLVTSAVFLHVRTFTLRSYISGMAWSIVFKFSVRLGTGWLRDFHKSRMGYICTSARAHPIPVSQEPLDVCA